MGRNPIYRARGQPQDAAKAPEEPESPEKPAFPRRFPRLGSQFQTKMPQSNGPLERPSPERMSTEYPHITELEAEKETLLCNGMYFVVFCRFGALQEQRIVQSSSVAYVVGRGRSNAAHAR
jgi:hypothetical protein